MSIFCCIVFFKRDKIRSRTLLGFSAVVAVLLSMISGFGLLFMCGVPFTSMTQLLPFVIFGIGLDDAFIVAGANTVVASLWQVSDTATNELMQSFYSYLSQSPDGHSSDAPMTIAQAMQAAQLSILGGNGGHPSPQRGLSITPITNAANGDGPTPNSPGSTGNLRHPYYWSPFVIIGNGLQ